jgi:hypothetical protein
VTTNNEPDARAAAESRTHIASPVWLIVVAAALWLFAPTLFRGEPIPGWRFDLRRTNDCLGLPFGLLSVLLALVVRRIGSRLLAWAAATSWLLTTLVYVVPWHLGLSGHRDYSAIEFAASLHALSLGSTAIILGAVAVRSLQGRDGWRAARAPRFPSGDRG